MHAIIISLDAAWLLLSRNVFKFDHDVIFITLFYGSSIDYVLLLLFFICMFSV